MISNLKHQLIKFQLKLALVTISTVDTVYIERW